jgi:hypothetical protein
MKSFKNHPFAVEAFFDYSLVLTFAVPKEQLYDYIPECLELDTYCDKWAFIAVALVQTQSLRPKGFPKFLGYDFFLIGYRIFVCFTNNSGKRLRGLYILKSETDKRKMEILGNFFTHYKYSTTDITQTVEGNLRTLKSKKSNFEITVEQTPDQAFQNIPIPKGSPFSNWKQARRYSGPLPFTYSYDGKNKTILIVEGVRQNWHPVPVKVRHYELSFLSSLKLRDAVLANAFEIRNIPYYWKKGKLEKWF